MRLSFGSKSVAALVLAFAAVGLGCAAPGGDVEEDVRTTQQALNPLAGIQGIISVTGMIQQTLEYGKPVSTATIYDQTVQLRADLAELNRSVDVQMNEVLIATDVSDMREIIAATEDYWNTLHTLPAGAEASFFADVRSQGQLTFGKLTLLDTILMGSDGLGSGMVAKTMETMRVTYGDGYPNSGRANVLGELMLRMRLVQLQALEVLGRAYGSTDTYTGYIDIAAKRAELLRRLENQGDVFFAQMRDYNRWAADSLVRWWAEASPADAAQQRADYLEGVYARETVLQGWNMVADGTSLDITPRLGIVAANYGVTRVTGSVAQMAMHETSIDARFSLQDIGAPSSMPAQATLTIAYRCEGQPGVQTVAIPDANGKNISLACSKLDRFVGTYGGSPSKVVITKPDANRLFWTDNLQRTWALTPTSVSTRLAATACWKDSSEPSGFACWDLSPDAEADDLSTVIVVDSPTRDPGAITLVWNDNRITKRSSSVGDE